MMKFSTSFLFSTFLVSVTAIQFNRNEAGGNDFKDLVFKHREFITYGPDLTSVPQQPSNEVWKGFGFGMGAAEHAHYDYKEGYMYIQSEEGPYISIYEWVGEFPAQTAFSLDLTEYDSDIKDVVVCPEPGLVFIAATDADKVLMYSTVQRNDPKVPKLLKEIEAGNAPDNLRPSNGCTVLAVANENDGESFAEGALHLVSDFRRNGGPVVKKVDLGVFTDDLLLSRGVHMPLSLNAMEYWDDYSDIKDDLNLGAMRENYKPSYFFMPEYMRFSADNSKLFINLQDNSALIQINVDDASVKRIDGYGLKSWEKKGIDLVKDNGCSNYVSSPDLYSMIMPDAIDILEMDGKTYVFTADEGTDFDFDEYEEKFDAGDIFDGTSLTLSSFSAPESFFSTSSSALGSTAKWNSECEDNGLLCLDGVEITVGSSAVDYSNPQAPVMDKLVLFGGRGISIFEVPDADEPIERIWDSGDDFEKEGCKAFPWAHNGVQDEDFAPLDGVRFELLDDDERDTLLEMNDPNQDGCMDAGDGKPGACPMPATIDEKSEKRGMEPELVNIAVACDRALAVSCGENNNVCFLYDVTNLPSPPVLRKVFNLSPTSQFKAPGPAYKDGTLGDLDPEASFSVSAEESPTGVPGLFFGGAHSGTMSFWEFECTNPVEAVERMFGNTSVTPEGSKQKLSGGAIAGIVIAVLVIAALVATIFVQSKKKQEVVILDGAKTDSKDAV